MRSNAHLNKQQSVETRTARKYHKRKTNESARHKSQLNRFAEERWTEIHENISADVIVAERHVTEKSNLF